jgi:integrase
MSDANSFPSFTLKLSGRWKGRTVRVFKKSLDPAASWYVCPEFRGRRFKTCLGTAARGAAEIKAAEMVDLIWSDQWAEWEKRRPRFVVEVVRAEPVQQPATWGQVFAAYRRIAGPVNGKRGIENNVKAARLVVREAAGRPDADPETVDAWPCAPTGGTVATFQRRRLAAAPQEFEARQSALVTLNANVRLMRSIFKENWRRVMVRDEGLVLPDLKEFLKESVEKPKDVAKAKPSRELLMKTFAASAALRKSDPPAFVAWVLAVQSLRRGEIQRMERSWLREVEMGDDADFMAESSKVWVIEIPSRTNRKRGRTVPVSDEVVEIVKSFWEEDSPGRAEEDRKFILPGIVHGQGGPGAVDRAHRILERVSDWMRGLGWETSHTLHEMRALCIRTWRAKHGLEMAQQLAGHSRGSAVTEKSYTGDKSLAGVVVRLPLGGEVAREGAKEAKVG